MLSDTVSDTVPDKPDHRVEPRAGAFTPAPGAYAHLADLLDLSLSRHADRIATVDADGHELTYRDLDARSHALAGRLAGAGVGRGAIVALCAGRSIDTLVAIVAILRAGAAYLPIDPAYPDAQLAFMLADATPTLVLADEAMHERLATLTPAKGMIAPPVWPLSEATCEHAVERNNAASIRDAEDIAYVMYTSGSTGRPKGVVVPHRAVARLVIGQSYCRFGADEVILHLAPLAFDASTFEIWAALLHGAKLAIVTQPRPSLADIADVLTGHGVTTAWLTAGLFHLMVETRLSALAGLRQLLAGGDVVSPGHMRRFLMQAPQARFVNGYGPTENTTFTCCAVVTAETMQPGPVPIGRAIAGTQVFVVDETLRPVASGEEGQLVASGAGLALGYLGREDLTDAAFVEAPAPISARIYLTGDLVRVRPDGDIEFLGRMDRQVKIDGKRVEPGEIEEALRGCAGIEDACVVVDEATGGVKRLIAFIVAGEHSGAPSQQLAQAAEAQLHRDLPAHMWPARLIPLTSFPLTPNGKVDRNALLRSLAATATDAPAPVASGLAGQIMAIWRRVLGMQAIGLDDVFFDLGGKSLQWMQVHEELERLLDVKIAITDMFARPTIRLLAEHLGKGAQAPAPAASQLADAARERARRQRLATMRRGRGQ